jgi:hypothetical protein
MDASPFPSPPHNNVPAETEKAKYLLVVEEIKPGIYQHYKGGRYLVLGVGQHEATGEKLVIYQPLYKHEGPELWVRDLAVFQETVTVEGKEVPRFRFLEEAMN